MASKTCPLMCIAHHTSVDTLQFPYQCVEHACAWYVKAKDDYACAIPHLANSMAAIGRLYADNRSSRGSSDTPS